MKEAVVFGIVAMMAGAIGLMIYGAVLAFKASIILGVLALIVEPSPFVIGIIGLCGHPELCAKIAAWIGLPI
jgi:hypothetical protein